MGFPEAYMKTLIRVALSYDDSILVTLDNNKNYRVTRHFKFESLQLHVKYYQEMLKEYWNE